MWKRYAAAGGACAVLLLLQLATIADTKESSPEENETEDAEKSSADLDGAESSFYNSFVNVNNFPTSYSYSSKSQQPRFPYIVERNASTCGDEASVRCERSRYRSYDGSCNNLQNPTWGMANTRFSRLVPAIYSDGISAPPTAVNGRELPLARQVSYEIFPSERIEDRVWTLATMQWGQIMVHDTALLADNSVQLFPPIRCCSEEGRLLGNSNQPPCFPMLIPREDPVYASAGYECLHFARTTTDIDRGCSSGNQPAEQINTVTHFLDASNVYGSSESDALSLRAGVGGRMLVDYRNNREWPPEAPNKTSVCDIDYEDEVCYVAGDGRVNQNPQLTVLQIILLREHNRVASELTKLNPHWNDETAYQETRRIVTAELQHISYYEWVPVIIGQQYALRYRIIYDTDGYVNDYDPSVDPSVINEHTTAANRYFHSLIAGYLRLIKEQRSSEGNIRLSNWFDKPVVLEERDNFDDLARGLSYQPESASDLYFDEEITQYLFRSRRRLGNDLRSVDIQRNRDHGLGSYNDLREYCGIRRATTWQDFSDLISSEDIATLSSLYESPDDVDLTVGGSMEEHLRGTLVGPTFLCILIEQFYRTRVGDRYWYETGDSEIAFTIEQLQEIRKTSIARLLCDNGDNIVSMQPAAFRLVGRNTNRIKDCNELPAVNLTWWKDYAPELSRKGKSFPSYKRR